MQKKYKIGIHVLAWMLLFTNRILPGYFYNIYQRDVYHGSFPYYFLITLCYFSTTILTFYFTALIIAPSFLKHKKWIRGILLTLLFFVISTAYRYVLEFHILLPYLNFDNYKGETPEVLWYIKNNVNYVFYSNFIYGFIFFITAEWYSNNRKQKELEKERMSAELAFLKSQVNPHFLFNTLNDIYTLTYQKSDLAPNALLKLSDLLRYMLKDSDEKYALLEKEILYLKDFIELHTIGQKGETYVQFNIEGDVKDQKIAPLILINFVENAFKHGVTDRPEHPVKIKLYADPASILFKVSNKKNNDIKDETGGIGLNNVKRRLALIYPERYDLKILDEPETYTIELKINL